MSSIVLFDLDRTGRRACWSPNVWKTRYVLNYKNLEYETQWLGFLDIAPTLEAQKIPQPAAGSSYTCPAITLRASTTDTIPLMDSLPIAKMLEKLHPEPSLHLDAPILSDVEGLVGQLMQLIGPIALPLMLTNTFTAKCAQYKEETISSYFGMSIDQFGKEKGGEAAWERMQEPLRDLAALLKKEAGPFILGNEVSYADFVVAAFLQSGKRIGNGEMYQRVVASDDAYEKLFEATKEWAVRDDR